MRRGSGRAGRAGARARRGRGARAPLAAVGRAGPRPEPPGSIASSRVIAVRSCSASSAKRRDLLLELCQAALPCVHRVPMTDIAAYLVQLCVNPTSWDPIHYLHAAERLAR
jgi:hypothetical protein